MGIVVTEYQVQYRTPKGMRYPNTRFGTNGKWEYLRDASSLDAAQRMVSAKKAAHDNGDPNAWPESCEYRIVSRTVTSTPWRG